MTPVPVIAILKGANRIRSENVTLNAHEKGDLFKNLEFFGVEQVRQMLPHGKFPPASESYVIEWLAEKDRDATLRAAAAADRASTAAERQATAAERAAAAAERANKRATIAIAIAMLSMVISAISTWNAHSDAGRATWTENPG